MKKHLYTLLLVAASATLFACNTTSSEWTREQRETIRRALHEYREMVYIDELSDAEFYIFTDNATEHIEYLYPNYDAFISMPALTDTLDMVVTTIIVEQLDADGSNIRHIYPYRTLRKEQILPKRLSRKDQRSFYKCLARKIDAQYKTFEAFFSAVVTDKTDTGEISMMQAECAKSLFDYTKPESPATNTKSKK